MGEQGTPRRRQVGDQTALLLELAADDRPRGRSQLRLVVVAVHRGSGASVEQRGCALNEESSRVGRVGPCSGACEHDLRDIAFCERSLSRGHLDDRRAML
jgi:hypothetical protein